MLRRRRRRGHFEQHCVVGAAQSWLGAAACDREIVHTVLRWWQSGTKGGGGVGDHAARSWLFAVLNIRELPPSLSLSALLLRGAAHNHGTVLAHRANEAITSIPLTLARAHASTEIDFFCRILFCPSS